MKSVILRFDSDVHRKISEKKEELKMKLGLKKLSWENYIIKLTGVKNGERNY